MKILIFILLPLLGLAQVDDVVISPEKLISLAKEKQEIIKKDSINSLIILEQAKQIYSYTTLIKQDSVEINLLNVQLGAQTKIINMLDPRRKTKWYESNWFYYLLGSTTMYLSAHIVSNIK